MTKTQNSQKNNVNIFRKCPKKIQSLAGENPANGARIHTDETGVFVPDE